MASLTSACLSIEESSPVKLITGSPTKLNKEKETKATTTITRIACKSLLKK
jgi:hypothetical protein